MVSFSKLGIFFLVLKTLQVYAFDNLKEDCEDLVNEMELFTASIINEVNIIAEKIKDSMNDEADF
jgi:hypothetical protein